MPNDIMKVLSMSCKKCTLQVRSTVNARVLLLTLLIFLQVAVMLQSLDEDP